MLQSWCRIAGVERKLQKLDAIFGGVRPSLNAQVHSL